MKIDDLESLIGKLKTDEGKSHAMAQVVETHLVDDMGFYQRTVGLAMRVGNYFPLLKIALKRGDDETYMAALNQLGFFTDGVRFAHGRGYFHREIEFLRRWERHIAERGKSRGQAHFVQAYNAEQNGYYLEAARLFELDGSFWDAGRNYSKGKDLLNALRCFTEGKGLFNIALTKEKLGNLNEAQLDYERSGKFYFAARVSEKIGDNEMAGVYEKLGLLNPSPNILIHLL